MDVYVKFEYISLKPVLKYYVHENVVTVTLTFDLSTTKIWSVHLCVQMDFWAKFEETPSKWSWNSVFPRMGHKHNVRTTSDHRCIQHRAIKSAQGLTIHHHSSTLTYCTLVYHNSINGWQYRESSHQHDPGAEKFKNDRGIDCFQFLSQFA